MIAEQVSATVESEATSRYEERVRVVAEVRESELSISASSQVNVRSQLDTAGLVRVVDTAVGNQDTCVLACLSRQEAAAHQGRVLAALREEADVLLREIRGHVENHEVLAALPKVRRVREQYARQREASLLLEVFAPGSPDGRDRVRELLAAYAVLRKQRAQLVVQARVVLTGADPAEEGAIVAAIKSRATDALSRRDVRANSRVTHELVVEAALRCSVSSDPTCQMPATVTLLASGGHSVRSGVVSSSATQASRPSREAATMRSTQMLGDEIEHMLNDWLGEE